MDKEKWLVFYSDVKEVEEIENLAADLEGVKIDGFVDGSLLKRMLIMPFVELKSGKRFYGLRSIGKYIGKLKGGEIMDKEKLLELSECVKVASDRYRKLQEQVDLGNNNQDSEDYFNYIIVGVDLRALKAAARGDRKVEVLTLSSKNYDIKESDSEWIEIRPESLQGLAKRIYEYYQTLELKPMIKKEWHNNYLDVSYWGESEKYRIWTEDKIYINW